MADLLSIGLNSSDYAGLESQPGCQSQTAEITRIA